LHNPSTFPSNRKAEAESLAGNGFGLSLSWKAEGTVKEISMSQHIGRTNEKLRKENLMRFSRGRKIIKEQKRSGCAICGYDRYTGALVFHHINPQDKNSKAGQALKYNWSPARLMSEISKCVVVCCNCHAEIHAGMHPGYLEIESVIPDGMSLQETQLRLWHI
jgi:hypothetical protein